MSNYVFLVHGGAGFLEVSVAPAAPFLRIPMVVAKKKEEEPVFGESALEKDESWSLTWLQGGRAHEQDLFCLFRFVSRLPSVRKEIQRCKHIFVCIQYVIAKNSGGGREYLQYTAAHMHGILPPESPTRKIYHASEDRLSCSGRQELGVRYCLNIATEFTCIRRSESELGYFSANSFIKIGIDSIVNLFIKLLCEKGYDFTSSENRLLCQSLVMEYCYVATDFEKELERIQNLDEPLHEVEMEDGTVLELGKECIIAPEVLFNPGLVGMDEANVMSLFEREDFRSCSRNIPLILTGRFCPHLKGFRERIQHELESANVRFAEKPINFVDSNIGEDILRFSFTS